jgi:hypothetical protein
MASNEGWRIGQRKAVGCITLTPPLCLVHFLLPASTVRNKGPFDKRGRQNRRSHGLALPLQVMGPGLGAVVEVCCPGDG